MTVPSIFICHSHFDNEFCGQLYQWLVTTLAADVFYDTQRLHGGDDWMDRIQRELEHRPLFILVLSRSSIEATWVRVETKLALDLAFSVHTHRIIPIVIDAALTRADINKLSSFLHIFQRIDLSPTASKGEWQKLADVVRGLVSERSSDGAAAAQLPQIEKAARDAMMVHDELKAGRYQEVVFYATRALQNPANADDATIWSDLARAHDELGYPEQAMAALEHSLTLNEFVGENWNLKALWLARRTPPAINEAQEAWDQSLYHTRSPELREGYLRNEAQALLKVHAWKTVLQVCHRGLQFAPNDLDWLAWKGQANNALSHEATVQVEQGEKERERHEHDVLKSHNLAATVGKCHIISIANQKGRTGKTTTAVNLAVYLAAAGKKVLLIDMCPDGNASTFLDVAHVSKHSLYELLVRSGVMFSDLIIFDTRPNLSILPSTTGLFLAELEMADIPEREMRLRGTLAVVKKYFDVILIDCPSSLGLLTLNAFTASDGVIIPLPCDYSLFSGLSTLLNTIKRVRVQWNTTLEIFGVFLTMFDSRERMATEVAREIKTYYPKEMFQTVIGRNIRLAESPFYGKSILEYDPDSPGALAYKALTEEVLARM